MPKVSILIPVYNADSFLADCIESVERQSFSDWELVVVNDGSTDNTQQILDRFAEADSRIKVYCNNRKGISAVRNRALSLAQSEFIFFLDADDTIHPDALSTLLAIREASGCKIVSGKYVQDASHIFKPFRDIRMSVYKYEAIVSNILYQKKSFDNCIWNKLIDRRLFDGLEFADTYFEDLDIFYRLYKRAGEIALFDGYTYFYRKHPDSIVNSWSPKRMEILDVADKLVAYMDANEQSLVRAARHRQFSAYFNVLNGLLRYEPDNISEINRCLELIKRLRTKVLFDNNSRMKNRIGALLSFLGSKSLAKVVRWRLK